MTRDELEAAFRRETSHIVALAVKDTHFGGVDLTAAFNTAVDVMLTAADRYAAATLGEIDNYRRNAPASMHWQVHHPQSGPACGTQGVCTTAARDVTCKRCKITRAYRERKPA